MTTLVGAEVVVTGMGVVSPAGCDLDELWRQLCAGRSTAQALDDVDHVAAGRYIGCRVRNFDPTSVPVAAKVMRRLDPFAQFGLAAAMKAHCHAGSPRPEAARGAVIVGNAVGGRTTSDRESLHFARKGASRVNPLMPIMTMANAAAAQICIELGWRGPSWSIATTCASSADAIGHAAHLLAAGGADVVLAGGCEATLSPVTLAAFSNLSALSTRLDNPAAASRPFDLERDGFVMGEGAAFLVLERRPDAIARGVTPLARITGYGSTSDAHHLTMPSADGTGAIEAMEAAISSAGLLSSEIVHVNAHGTSTPLNDRTEAFALRKVLATSLVPVTATKGVVGHLIGAAGALEVVATVLALRHRLVPPTANHDHADPEIELDVVHGTPRPILDGPALTNSFGFGGHNASLVVEPP
jgi:3-oxoacyl-[acyl-carrier-protein] synthase II